MPLPSASGIVHHKPAQPSTLFIGTDDISPQNVGTDFWLAFLGGDLQREVSLFITGATDTTGTVAIPGLGFSTPFTVTAGAVTTVMLPSDVDLEESSDTVEDKGIHVTAQEAVVAGVASGGEGGIRPDEVRPSPRTHSV